MEKVRQSKSPHQDGERATTQQHAERNAYPPFGLKRPRKASSPTAAVYTAVQQSCTRSRSKSASSTSPASRIPSACAYKQSCRVLCLTFAAFRQSPRNKLAHLEPRPELRRLQPEYMWLNFHADSRAPSPAAEAAFALHTTSSAQGRVLHPTP